VAYNLIGGFVWAIGVTTAGFLLGRRFPALADNLVYVSAIIVAISLLPGVVEFVKHRRSQRQPA
jgi:membrane-associated protein